jgi:hypothetical protein
MKTWFEQVQEFSCTANKAQNALDPRRWPLIPKSETPMSESASQFIVKMVRDELEELKEAKTDYEQADALLDIIYYILDTAAKHCARIDFETARRFPERTPKLFRNVDSIIQTIEAQLDKVPEQQFSILTVICSFCFKFADAEGFDLNPLFDIVQEANMAKFKGGVSLDADPNSPRYGKVLKPKGWIAPDELLKEAVKAQKIVHSESLDDLDEWVEQQRKAHGNL